MTVDANMKHMKQWSTCQNLQYICPWHLRSCRYFLFLISPLLFHTLSIQFHLDTYLFYILLCDSDGTLSCRWLFAAECTLIQAQRPDVCLLLDFFQPAVANLCFSWPAIKAKHAVQLLHNYSTVNIPFCCLRAGYTMHVTQNVKYQRQSIFSSVLWTIRLFSFLSSYLSTVTHRRCVGWSASLFTILYSYWPPFTFLAPVQCKKNLEKITVVGITRVQPNIIGFKMVLCCRTLNQCRSVPE